MMKYERYEEHYKHIHYVNEQLLILKTYKEQRLVTIGVRKTRTRPKVWLIYVESAFERFMYSFISCS